MEGRAKPKTLIGKLGWMRILLFAVAIISIVATPKPGTLADYATWRIVPTLLIPVLTPLIFMLLLMDSLMSRIWMTDKEADARHHYRVAIALNLLFAAGIVLAWYPYFHALSQQ